MSVLVGNSALVGPGPLVGGGVLPAGGGALAAPVLARPTITGESSVLLAWTGGTGSDLIERSLNAGGSWSTVASGQATPYTATSQTEITSQDVWYRVKAGGTGNPSNSGIARLWNGGSAGLNDTWTTPTGAEDAQFDAYGNGVFGSGDGTGGGGAGYSATAVSTPSGDYDIHIESIYYGGYLTTVKQSAVTICAAQGAGTPASDNPGLAANGTGDLKTSGGNGGAPNGGNGGGGGAGGPNGNGTNGQDGPAGAGGASGGGLGGDGGAVGSPGLNFGGGGGGALTPGSGAPGAIALTCTKPA